MIDSPKKEVTWEARVHKRSLEQVVVFYRDDKAVGDITLDVKDEWKTVLEQLLKNELSW